MTTEELKELIKKLVQEYNGTGASGGNATDGTILLLLDLLQTTKKN